MALDARRQFAAHGIEAAQLRPCRDEGRDGTRLPGCVKTYLPAPAGDWGMVFQARFNEHGQPFMHCLALGFRPQVCVGQRQALVAVARPVAPDRVIRVGDHRAERKAVR